MVDFFTHYTPPDDLPGLQPAARHRSGGCGSTTPTGVNYRVLIADAARGKPPRHHQPDHRTTAAGVQLTRIRWRDRPAGPAARPVTGCGGPRRGRELLVAARPVGRPLAARHRPARRRATRRDLASAALTQAGLRRRAAAKFGADAARMYFTAAGLEQATRAVGRRPPGPPPGRARRRPGRRPGVRHRGGHARLRPGRPARCSRSRPTRPRRRWPRRTRPRWVWPTWSRFGGRRHHGRPLRCGRRVLRPGPPRRGTGRRVFDPSAYSPPWTLRRSPCRPACRPPCSRSPPGSTTRCYRPGPRPPGSASTGTSWRRPSGAGRWPPSPAGPRVLRGGRGARAHRHRSGDGAGRSVGALALRPRRGGGPRPPGGRVRGRRAGTAGRPPHRLRLRRPRPPTPYGRCFEVMEELPFARKRLRAALRGLGHRPAGDPQARAGGRSRRAAPRAAAGRVPGGHAGARPVRRHPDRPALLPRVTTLKTAAHIPPLYRRIPPWARVGTRRASETEKACTASEDSQGDNHARPDDAAPAQPSRPGLWRCSRYRPERRCRRRQRRKDRFRAGLLPVRGVGRSGWTMLGRGTTRTSQAGRRR